MTNLSSALSDWISVRDKLLDAETDLATFRSVTLQALKHECVKKNIRQSDIAKRLNISRAYVCDIWRGRRELTMTIAKRIAGLLG